MAVMLRIVGEVHAHAVCFLLLPPPVNISKPEQKSPEVQNRGISGPTKETNVLQSSKKIRKYISRCPLSMWQSDDIIELPYVYNGRTN